MSTDPSVLILHSILAVSALVINGTLLTCLLMRTQITFRSNFKIAIFMAINTVLNPQTCLGFAILMRIHVLADMCNVICCFGHMDR